MRMNMNIKKYLVVFFVVFVFVFSLFALWYVFLRDDGDMVFPKKAQGTFIEQPRIIEDSGKRFVQWTLPESCARNSYEFQNVGYHSTPEDFWGGRGDDTVCESLGDGYQCRSELMSEMVDRPSGWNIQVSSYGCSNGRSFVSDMVTF